MSFLGRNPRYALALLTLLFFASILLFNSNRQDVYSDAIAPYRMGRVSTIDFLRQTEAGYQQSVIRGRQDLIRKHGPTISKVNP